MTIDECYKVISGLNENNPIISSEDELRYKANWLYFLNRLNFWEEMPILLELIKQEIQRNKVREEQKQYNKSNYDNS